MFNSSCDQVHENIWITDITTIREQSIPNFTHVITVCQEGVEDNISSDIVYDDSHKFNLADGVSGYYKGECTYELFEDAADKIFEVLQESPRLLVHCHAGQSRSAATTIAAVARFESESYKSIHDAVKKERPQINPNETLEKFARRYIENHSS